MARVTPVCIRPHHPIMDYFSYNRMNQSVLFLTYCTASFEQHHKHTLYSYHWLLCFSSVVYNETG